MMAANTASAQSAGITVLLEEPGLRTLPAPYVRSGP